MEGDSVGFYLPGQYDATNEWMTQGELDEKSTGGKQNVFAGENLGVSIKSSDGRVNETVTEALNISTGEMEPLNMTEGARMDLMIDFKDGNISARMHITPWGVVDDNIEF